ncbi:hypothetical protein MTO96_032603 [Rhipicephalus appendiculatus]
MAVCLNQNHSVHSTQLVRAIHLIQARNIDVKGIYPPLPLHQLTMARHEPRTKGSPKMAAPVTREGAPAGSQAVAAAEQLFWPLLSAPHKWAPRSKKSASSANAPLAAAHQVHPGTAHTHVVCNGSSQSERADDTPARVGRRLLQTARE